MMERKSHEEFVDNIIKKSTPPTIKEKTKDALRDPKQKRGGK